MTIKEVEERTGLARSNVRFYEKEKLIALLLVGVKKMGSNLPIDRKE